MNASSGATTIRLHGVLRFAVAVTAAFVIGEVMQWWPSFLAAVLVAVLLASLPVRPTPRMALGLVMVMTVVAWAPYLLASLLRGTPIVLFGLTLLGMFLAFLGLLLGRARLPAMLLLICLAVIPVVVLTAPAQAAVLPWALVRGMALAVVLMLGVHALWPALPAPSAAPPAGPLPGSPLALAIVSTLVLLPVLLVYLLLGLVDALPVIVTTVMLVINFETQRSARHALALVLGNLAGGLLGWCLHLALLSTPNLLFLSLLLLLVMIGFGRWISAGGAVSAVALVACNAALIIFGTALATGPTSVMVWLTRLTQFALSGAVTLTLMHLLWRWLPRAAAPSPSPSASPPSALSARSIAMTTLDSPQVPGVQPSDPRQRRRLILGVAVWIVGWILGLGLMPVVEASTLSDGLKTTLNGVLLLGFPKLFLVLAVAIMGKPGFAYLKSLIGGHLRRFAPAAQVSPVRYRIGLILFIAVIVLSSVGPYVAPQTGSLRMQHPHLVAMSGDLLLVVSLFLLGGDFWDKLRSLFVRDAKAVFPPS